MSFAARKDSAERALKIFRREFEVLPAAKRFEVLALLQVMCQAEANAPALEAPKDQEYAG